MIRRYIVVILLLLNCFSASCSLFEKESHVEDGVEAALTDKARKTYQFSLPQQDEEVAEIVIKDYGSIYIKLFSLECPITVENFISKARNGYYNGIPINRIINNYIIQAGVQDDEEICFKDEYSEKLQPYRGAVCTANKGEPDTNGNQFFLVQAQASSVKELEELVDFKGYEFYDYLRKGYDCELSEKQLKDYYLYGGAPWLYRHNTVFGQIIIGYDVLDKIADVQIKPDDYSPAEELIIEGINIIRFRDLEDGYVG